MSSAPPQPGRQKAPQSPPHQPSVIPTRPPPRPNQYPPRYYRTPVAGPTPSPAPSFGWTPRTPASPHAPLSGRPHVRPPPIAVSHHSAPPAPPPVASPRLNVAAPPIAKPGPKPNLSPIPISPSVAAHTPSWLKGNYKPHTPKTPSSEASSVEQWCKDRLEAIKNTVEGKSEDIKELRSVMDNLDSAKVSDEIALIRDIRKDFWKTRERQRKAESELRRAEREVQRIDHLASQVRSKITRLRNYARFIESGWVDEHALDQGVPDGGHIKEERKLASPEQKPGEQLENESMGDTDRGSEQVEIVSR